MGQPTNRKTTDRHNGKQLNLWVPDAFFDLLQARASRNHTSAGTEARILMEAGLPQIEKLDDIREAMIDLMRYFELHLEPLAFIAAMDASFGAESWRYQLLTATQGDVAKMKEIDQKLRDRAKRRIQRKLRELDVVNGDAEGDDDDGED